MASIQEWIQKIRTSIYGREVRDAIASSIDEMNGKVDKHDREIATAILNAETAAQDAEEAKVNAIIATQNAMNAAEHASQAASEAEQIVPTVNNHISNKSNPHDVTKAQVGLGNVDNTADANKSVKYAETAGTAKASDVYSWAKQQNKPSYNAAEVGALPSTTSIPSKLSDLTADASHRTVTDTEKNAWNQKSKVSVSQKLTSGEEIGSVTVDGITTKLFAPQGGDGMELLWTNPLPTSNFAEQTVNFSDTYNRYIIRSKSSKSSSTEYVTQAVADDNAQYGLNYTGGSKSATSYLYHREFTAKNNSIVFGAGYRKAITSTTAPNSDNQYAIPIEIYGIK